MVNWLRGVALCSLTQNQRNAVRKRCRGRTRAFDRFERVRRRPRWLACKLTLMFAGKLAESLAVFMLAV